MRYLPIVLFAALFVSANAQELPPQLSTAELGYVAGINYHNDVLGLKIQRPPGWDMFTAGQMNVGEAVTGRWSTVPAAVIAHHTRVLGLTDSSTAIAMLAVVKLRPEDARRPLPDITSEIRASMLRHLPHGTGRPQPVKFGDADHPFAEFRVHASEQGEEALLSDHVTLINGYLIQVIMVSDTAAHLTAAEKLVKAGIEYTAPKP